MNDLTANEISPDPENNEFRAINQGEQPTIAEIDKYGQNLTVSELLKDERYLEPYKLTVQEIRNLDAPQRSALVRLYGRLAASLHPYYVGHVLAHHAASWKKNVIAESGHLFTNAELKPLVEKIYAQVAFFIATESDTNTQGGAPKLLRRLIYDLANELGVQRLAGEARLLLNPFELTEATPYYKLDSRLEALEEHIIQDVLLEGEDSLVQVDQDVQGLANFNAELALGELMLRDGRNYFGKFEFPAEIALLQPGDQVKITVTIPIRGEETFEAVFNGTNQTELEEKYGQAYLAPRHLAALLQLYITYQGRQAPMAYRDITRIEKS